MHGLVKNGLLYYLAAVNKHALLLYEDFQQSFINVVLPNVAESVPYLHVGVREGWWISAVS